jgi:EpsI family protein
MRVHPSFIASALILLVSLVWLLARLVHLQLAHQLSLVALIGLLVIAVIGFGAARLFIAPLVLLVFAVPVGEPLVPYFQVMFAKLAVVMLNATGIPSFLEGTHIWVPAGTFEVKPACSGITQLTVAGAAGVLFATMRSLRVRTAVWVTAGAACVAIVTNALRIYVTVLVGQFSGMQHYLVTEHWASAWVLFGLGMLGFFLLVGRVVSADGYEPTMTRPETVAPPATGSASPRVTHSALIALSALAVGPALLPAYEAANRQVEPVAFELPNEIDGWRAGPVVTHGFRPSFQQPDVEREKVYKDGRGRQVYVYVAAYVHQTHGKEAVHTANSVLGDSGWYSLWTRTRALTDGTTVRETRARSKRGGEKLVWQWYYLHGSAVSSGYSAKLLNAWATFKGDPSVAAVVIASDLRGTVDPAQTEADLTRFFADAQQTIADAIDGARRKD